MFKKINSENLLWLINGEEPMPADKTVHKTAKKWRKGTLQRQQRSMYTTVEGSNVTVSWLCFTVSRKSQVTHKQECCDGAPRSQFSHI